jgi:predicted nuclease with TOPRIM domain
MDSDDILTRVNDLVSEEHALRERLQRGEIGVEEERQRLQTLEVALDQCWDLLRQRRARAEAGQDPNQVAPRPTDQVEGYLQ